MATKINKLGLGGLALGHLAVDMQTSSLAVMIPLLLVRFQLDYATAALIVTANTLTSYALQPLFGWLSDRRPLRWMLPLGCFLGCGGMVSVLFLPEYWMVLMAVIVSGLGAAMYHPEGSRNANYVSGDQKATAMSFFFFSGNVGQALGPIVLTLLIGLVGVTGALGMLVPGVVAGLLLWQLIPLYANHAAKRAIQGKAAVTESKATRGWLMLKLLGVISIRSMIQTGLVTFIPLYFVSLAASNKDYAALLLSVFVLAGAIGTLAGGPLADRFGHKTVMVGSLGLVMPLLWLFLNSSGIVQVVAIGLSGLALVSASSLTVVMAQATMPNNIGLATGLTLGLGFGAGGIGASALGKYADWFGLNQTMFLIALLPIAAVALSLTLPYKAKKQSLISPAKTEGVGSGNAGGLT